MSLSCFLNRVACGVQLIFGLWSFGYGLVAALDCGDKPLDIVFSLDASLSVGSSNWELVKDFVTDLISTEVDPLSNVAVNHFAKGSWNDVTFLDIQSPRDTMINTISNIIFPTIDFNGQTYTHDGVSKGISEFLFNGRSLDDADRLIVLMTDGKPIPEDTQSPCDLKPFLDASGIKVLIIGIGNDWQLTAKDHMTCLIEDETNDMIYVDSFSQNAFDQVKEKVGQAICPPSCEYTHNCNVWGDPHITTFDGLKHHFQGSGWFDYLKPCGITGDFNDGVFFPITISGKHTYYQNTPYTVITEIIVKLKYDDKTHLISFPTNGDSAFPTYKNTGGIAMGQKVYEINNNNNDKFTTLITPRYFEITFPLLDGTNRIGKIKFTYNGWKLNLDVSDCISDYICGLCGIPNDDISDEFTKCNNPNIIIDNTGVSFNKPYKFTSNEWERTHEFGESCCNYQYDELYLTSNDLLHIKKDCQNIPPTPPPPPSIPCLEQAESICIEAYNKRCTACLDEPLTDSWLTSCAIDVCAMNECKNAATNNILTYNLANNYGCLETSLNFCDTECKCLGCSAGGSIGNNDCYAFGEKGYGWAALSGHYESSYGVFACYGEFSGGMNDKSVDNICGNGYSVCGSAFDAYDMGLEPNDCRNKVGENEIFFLRETSDGNGLCQSKDNDYNGGNNDVWGCSGAINSNTNSPFWESQCRYIDHVSSWPSCYAMSHVCGRWTNLNNNNDNTILDQGTDTFNEYKYMSLNDDKYGGVLCCAPRPKYI